MKEIFNKDFLAISPQEIVSKIKKDGYFSFPHALTSEFINNIESDIKNNRLGINNNRICGVETKTQYYHTNMLCISKSFYNYITGPQVYNISKTYFENSKFRIKAHRYYETNGYHKMIWHSDNKLLPEKKLFSDVRGLIFISYISDVYDGEFQYIEGSQKISENKKLWTEKEILDNFGAKSIKSFKGSKGEIIIYDTSGIHRAKPFNNPNNIRKSLFFQIDLYDDAEPLFINPAFINNLNEQNEFYLGFGRSFSGTEFPVTTVRDLSLLSFIDNIFIKWLKSYFRNLPRMTYKFLKVNISYFLKKYF